MQRFSFYSALERGREIVANAERDLRRTLDGGERRDLLADNTAWDSETIRDIVTLIGNS